MTVLNKEKGSERTDIEVKRGLRIVMANGIQYLIEEDVEGFMQITKEYSDGDNLQLNVNPRQSNQITVN